MDTTWKFLRTIATEASGGLSFEARVLDSISALSSSLDTKLAEFNTKPPYLPSSGFHGSNTVRFEVKKCHTIAVSMFYHTLSSPSNEVTVQQI